VINGTSVMLNIWWCSHHWEAFAHDKDAAKRAADAIVKALATKPDLQRAVQQRQEKYRVGMSRAAGAVIDDWVGRNDMPVCCLLGDAVMEEIRSHVCPSASESA